MKRVGNLWENIIDIDNIKNAIDLSIINKKETKIRKTISTEKDFFAEKIYDILKSQKHVFTINKSFEINEPKQRIIDCPPYYPDRIIHHALMNVIKPILLKRFIFDTYGAIKNKGIHKLSNKLFRVLKTYDNMGYFLKIDIKKFYQNINNDILKTQYRKIIKCKKTINLIDNIIDAHSNGLPIGSLVSQYSGNLYLSWFDRYVKEELRIKHYFRYMDDMVFLFETKEIAKLNQRKIKEYIQNELLLEINSSEKLAPINCGIDFVGYVFYKTHYRLRKSIKIRMRRRINSLLKNNVSDVVFKRKTASYFGWAKKCFGRNLIRKYFNRRIYLYVKNMEFKRLSEIRQKENWFGLPKNSRVSILDLCGKEVILYEYIETTIKNEQKIVVCFGYLDAPEEKKIFITRSVVVKDRLEKYVNDLPFIAKIDKKNDKYFFIE